MVQLTKQEIIDALTENYFDSSPKANLFSELQIKYVIDNVGVINSLPKSILKKIFDAQQIRFLMKLFDVK